MNNPSGTTASREEEIAFLIVEKVLGVDIQLADAARGNGAPDGAWTRPGQVPKLGLIEVTSPPDTQLMRDWADAKKDGQPQHESGCVPLRWNALADFCTELLQEEWALANIKKLTSRPAVERHLFLFGRSYRVENYFYRLSDTCQEAEVAEDIDGIALPDGITDIWFQGRTSASRNSDSVDLEVRVARFQREVGWQRHSVKVDERQLPPPNPSLGSDPIEPISRRPKVRTIHRSL